MVPYTAWPGQDTDTQSTGADFIDGTSTEASPSGNNSGTYYYIYRTSYDEDFQEYQYKFLLSQQKKKYKLIDKQLKVPVEHLILAYKALNRKRSQRFNSRLSLSLRL